ncbi:hypothetical protein H2202_007879 [Exophiala xenobiotica]|nr:hypothetical protein H2202_007879 [Exophiala xenobiotica]
MPIPTPVKSYGLARPGAALPRRHRLKARNADAIAGVNVSLVAAAFSESRRNHMTKLVKSSEIVSPRYVQTAQHAINAQPLPTPDLTPSQILRRVVALLGGTDRDRARPSVPDPGRKTVTTQDVVYVLNRYIPGQKPDIGANWLKIRLNMNMLRKVKPAAGFFNTVLSLV